MKTSIFILALLLFTFLLVDCTEKPKDELTEQIKSGLRKDSKEFMVSLKSILVKEMQENGVVSAVSVCSDTAQILTNDYGISKGIYIKRVSFKNRNPKNYPDYFETKALKYFEDLKSENKLTETSEYIDVVDNEGIKSVRYLKPIVLQAPCLSCHGPKTNISAEVKSIIEKKYPQDKAIDYQTDDLRGAVSIQKTL